MSVVATGRSRVDEVLQTLWGLEDTHPFYPLLPRVIDDLRTQDGRIKAYMDALEVKTRIAGRIDGKAVIEGKIVFMGPGARIEAGAIVHHSCRLFMGPGATIRSGAVLRDEVLLGERSMVGVNSEVVRSILLPDASCPHLNFLGDSILGQGVNLAGGTIVANTSIKKHPIRIRMSSVKESAVKEVEVDTDCLRLGLLCGDLVSFGFMSRICPGTLVLPGLSLPPATTLLGIVDAKKRKRLLSRFFESVGDT